MIYLMIKYKSYVLTQSYELCQFFAYYYEVKWMNMEENILRELERQLDSKEFDVIRGRVMHLGVFTEPCLSYMLEGKKTIESRFSKNKILPYEKITKDDIVVVKKSGGNVVGFFTIKECMFFNLQKISISDIRKNYDKELCVDDSFWIEKSNSNYATLIFIDKLYKLEPFRIIKKGMQTWVKLN